MRQLSVFGRETFRIYNMRIGWLGGAIKESWLYGEVGTFMSLGWENVCVGCRKKSLDMEMQTTSETGKETLKAQERWKKTEGRIMQKVTSFVIFQSPTL